MLLFYCIGFSNHLEKTVWIIFIIFLWNFRNPSIHYQYRTNESFTKSLKALRNTFVWASLDLQLSAFIFESWVVFLMLAWFLGLWIQTSIYLEKFFDLLIWRLARKSERIFELERLFDRISGSRNGKKQKKYWKEINKAND